MRSESIVSHTKKVIFKGDFEYKRKNPEIPFWDFRIFK